MDSKHSDDDYIINDTEYEEDEADIALTSRKNQKERICNTTYNSHYMYNCLLCISRYAHKDTARV